MIPLRLAVYGVLCLTLVSGSASATARRHDTSERKDLDLTASAQPSSALATTADTASDITWSSRREVKADTVATSTATCDGCTGDSTALQVLYLPRATQADLDNSAVAWATQCLDCGATALSVQVVVLRGGSTLVPNNRAMAVNAACERCGSAAAAFQLVVVAPRVHRLPSESLAQLQSWFDQQAAALRAPAPTEGLDMTKRTEADGSVALDALETLVNTELDSETLTADVVLSD